MRSLFTTNKSRNILGIILIAVAFGLFVFAVYTFLPVHENSNPPVSWGWGIDWKRQSRIASLQVISGLNPYDRVIRCLPPWIYVLISPIALLPPDLGSAVIFALTYFGYSFVLYRLKPDLLMILAFVCNPFMYHNAVNANFDFLAVLGFILPPQIGLFLVLAKPQIGIAIAIFWLVEAWRKGKAREVIRVFAPVTVAYLLSFMIYGFWPLKVMGMVNDAYNYSLWPAGIIVGLILLYKSIKDRDPLFAMGASPFLAPYVNMTSLAVLLIPFVRNSSLMIIAVALTLLPFFH